MNLLFYLAGAVAIISTLAVILQTNIVHGLIYLILSLLSVAVVFYTLGAPFAAVLEAIVYAGAIMVLFLFVMMMLNLGQRTLEQERVWLAGRHWLGAGIMAGILLVQLLLVLRQSEAVIEPLQVDARAVSLSLFGPYVLAVELASMLLLAALVGAFHLARK